MVDHLRGLRARAGAALVASCLTAAACGGGAATGTSTPPPPDPHPCDLLTSEQAGAVLGGPVTAVVRLEAVESDGGQASCAWEGTGETDALSVIVEGPSFFASGDAGYGNSEEAYAFWRDDILEAGFPVVDLEGVGDAAFLPGIGAGPLNAMVMRTGPFLVHVSLPAPSATEARLTEAGRLLSDALAGG